MNAIKHNWAKIQQRRRKRLTALAMAAHQHKVARATAPRTFAPRPV